MVILVIHSEWITKIPMICSVEVTCYLASESAMLQNLGDSTHGTGKLHSICSVNAAAPAAGADLLCAPSALPTRKSTQV